ncbi:tetratricopeptide repeat protein [Salegentibacter holothuriorum]|nr:tetratricopeptide repeat protein [Salegentibacter holothuriorum]
MSFLRGSLFVIFGFLFSFQVAAQQQNDKEREQARKEALQFMQEADEALGENNFPEAEAAYRKAIARDAENSTAPYNMGNMYYTRENSPQAAQRFRQAAEVADTKTAKHEANHNLGNAYMKQKKYQEAVDAYKDALRNNPTDDETRYNLALAKKMLEQQQQDQNQDGGDNENQDQENQDQENQDQNQDEDQENKENQDQENQGEGENEGDKDQQNKDQEEKEGDQDEKDQQDGQGDQEEKEKEKQPQQGQPQPTQGQLSPEQIQSLLEAMNNEERKVQDKINAEKQKGAKVKSEKDW